MDELRAGLAAQLRQRLDLGRRGGSSGVGLGDQQGVRTPVEVGAQQVVDGGITMIMTRMDDGCDAISAESGLVIGVMGHAGDGNMHPTIVFDAADQEQRARAVAAFDAILELGLFLGGTITGEHGVGAIKVDWLEREIGPVSLSVHRAIKDALDPAGLLNPGKVIRPAAVRAGRVR